jgi:hypothetical protein
MSAQSYLPEFAEAQFNCPHCGVYSAQVWYVVAGRQGEWVTDAENPQPHSQPRPRGGTHHFEIQPFTFFKEGKAHGMSTGGKPKSLPPGDDDLVLLDFFISVCFHCSQPTFWRRQEMLFPTLGGIEAPNADLDPAIRADYLEAAAIAPRSPRGAAALLRLCLQRLCHQLGLPGKNLNDDIASLVQRGLNPDIQVALDSVRVIGNNAVHPLEMDLRDNLQTAHALFSIINYIAEQMITFAAKRAGLFASLPQSARDQIKKRDGT